MLTATAHRNPVKLPTSSQLARREPTQKEYERLVTPSRDNQKKIESGSKSDRVEFTTMDQARQAADSLTFHPLDPFVSSVASSLDARSVSEPKNPWAREYMYVSVEEFYGEPIPVEVGFDHGPDAPMMIILPGIFGGREGGYSTAYKKIALERGMNYAVIANPLSEESLGEEPVNHPGNIEQEAASTLAILERLQEKKPEYFDKVTLSGYSYGALLAANVAKLDEAKREAGADALVDGVIAVSPPENLFHSMEQLDSLRQVYAEGAGPITATALLYKTEIASYGYERFMESGLAERTEGTNLTEVKMADRYGSRNGMEEMVATVDSDFEHNKLPHPFFEYFERQRVLDNMTYVQYSGEWFSEDPWMKEQGITPQQLADRNSYSKALESMTKTPVMTILSGDDYILKPEDVQNFEKLEQSSVGLEHVRVLDHGGHVGILFNPAVQDFVGDFAFSAANWSEKEPPKNH